MNLDDARLLQELASWAKDHAQAPADIARHLDYRDRIAPMPDAKRTALARSLRAAADDAGELAAWLGAAAAEAARFCPPEPALTDRQRELLSKLVALSEQIEGYRATLAMLERERFTLQAELRATGFQASQLEQPELGL